MTPRQLSKQQGLPYYNCGRNCLKCDNVMRLVSNNKYVGCRDRNRQEFKQKRSNYMKVYWQKNKDKHDRYMREYRALCNPANATL